MTLSKYCSTYHDTGESALESLGISLPSLILSKTPPHACIVLRSSVNGWSFGVLYILFMSYWRSKSNWIIRKYCYIVSLAGSSDHESNFTSKPGNVRSESATPFLRSYCSSSFFHVSMWSLMYFLTPTDPSPSRGGPFPCRPK